MAEVMKVEVLGLDVLDGRLKELDRRTTGNFLRKALREGANVIKKEAKARVPVRTGRLKKGIHVTVTMKGGPKQSGEAYAKVGMKRKVAYGVPVELGTSRSAAKPFLRPAMDTKHNEAVKAFGSRLKDEIDKVTAMV